ncbi:uncharacterized protein LOC135221984 [Macrobrachium nipponense]|uniref:uncharacterized protein LOC135221984 n=1 Tax=Macrobrachium nipponense TaxID=159736 RepID=UPI0030C871E7
MRLLSVLACLQAFYVAESSLQPTHETDKFLGPEKAPTDFVMSSETDEQDGTPLTTKQKNFLSHPKVQKIINENLMHDLKAYEQDREENLDLGLDDEEFSSFPKEFIPPQLLAHLGVDWKALATAEDDEDDGEFEDKLDYLIKSRLDKVHVKESNDKADKTGRSSAWHPAAAFKQVFEEVENW